MGNKTNHADPMAPEEVLRRAEAFAPTPAEQFVSWATEVGECLAIPVQTARANLIVLCIARNMRAAPLCHGPALAALAVQSHIQGAEIVWIGNAALTLSRPSVIGGEYAAYKGNDREPVLAVVA